MNQVFLVLITLSIFTSGCGKQSSTVLSEPGDNLSLRLLAPHSNRDVPVIVSKKRGYVEPLEQAIAAQIEENNEAAKTSINIPRSPRFWTDPERTQFYRDELRLSEQELKFTLENHFATSLWNSLDIHRQQAFAKVQARWKNARVLVESGSKAVPIESLLPPHIQSAINKVPVEVPEVGVVSLFDLYRELVPEMTSSLPEEAKKSFQYPQCFSAVLWFYEIQRRPKIFLTREVLLGKKNIRVALREVLQENGFERVTKVTEQSDLKFGDILMFPPHAQVYLAYDLVFEKPNGDAHSPWRIMESNVTRTVKEDPELVVMRKRSN